MGIFGGGLMAWAVLGIGAPQFFEHLSTLYRWSYWIGLIKSPFFAVIIALIGCYEGFQVERSAESVGRLTTLSVVEAIFLVIVTDAGFSIFFSALQI
jgi:phospholipid/cholesterol/gamma-HCH transport system permease protein